MAKIDPYFNLEKERNVLLKAMSYHETFISECYNRLLQIDKEMQDGKPIPNYIPVQGSADVESYYR
jgi:hypothetical protein